ncbi:MAG: glycosyltransferase family 4 protein [Chloroflexi bacterium]|nr:glycosyltransferase family 4 protein [Chloroflexota bacterium]
MHIALANQWYPPESGWGGVAMYNQAVARALCALGHQVTVISSRADANIPAECVRDGVRVRRLLVRDAYRWRRLPGLGRFTRPAQQLVYARRVDRALRELHREQPIDLVEFAEINAEGFFYARSPAIPVVVRCHTPTFVLRRYYDRREMRYDTNILSWCEKDLIRRAHALTAPSQDMARTIATECRLPVENITVIPNALSISDFDSTFERSNAKTLRRPLTILHVGRLERVKGATVLVQAIPLVLRAVPDAQFVFIGDDRPTVRGVSQRAQLELQATTAGFRASVEFLGAVDQAVLMEWYGRADICVVPSMLYESFSYTCAQAMAAGKPVIASRIGGIPETVQDGVSGLLVEPGDPSQLAHALVRLARAPALCMQMGRAGRERAMHDFDPRKIAEDNLRVYETAIRHWVSL